MSTVTLGGDRLGSGNKNKIHLRNFERSTHDLSYLWKSTAQSGTLVPFMHEIALPGDTFDIDLDCDVMTHPTIGPLFGSYKVQLDVFQVPIRLYNAKLHMNALGIGMNMSEVLLPQIRIYGEVVRLAWVNEQYDIDNIHTSPSSLLAYLGIRGLGSKNDLTPLRDFNAVGLLGYWDIYKQYYANKQEEVGVCIHTQVKDPTWTVQQIIHVAEDGTRTIWPPTGLVSLELFNSQLEVTIDNPNNDHIKPEELILQLSQDGLTPSPIWIADLYDVSYYNSSFISYSKWKSSELPSPQVYFLHSDSQPGYRAPSAVTEPILRTFPLENIDQMREDILKWFEVTPFMIDAEQEPIAPYGWCIEKNETVSPREYSQTYTSNGLAIKTYQSDLFNNWISTEWIDGVDGISAITAVDTSSGSFTIDELNLSKKVYDMLNRIAVSGGSYDDWLDAVYTHERQRSAENPIYLGGMSQSLVFQEVVATADTRTEVQLEGEPLGTLAGKGRLSNNKKGGKVVVKVDEPSVLMGIFSLTPRVDFSQGNKWDVNLKSVDDLHKPSLDQIGFQDLITDQMAWYDTTCDVDGTTALFSAGKQPAWINYMTNVPVTRGNFAIAGDQMFMTLNRKYGTRLEAGQVRVADLTTYIDPAKFNEIFADTRLDAHNFWVQIAVNITARRKMSAKLMPNL